MLARFNLIFNPFDTVRYEGNVKPDSRTLHTSFIQKMQDTFQVFDGGTSIANFKEGKIYLDLVIANKKDELEQQKNKIAVFFALDTRPGLFDYATLGIFRLSHLLSSLFASIPSMNTKKYHGIKKVGAYIINALLQILMFLIDIPNTIGNGLIRHAASAILTLAVSPIVLLSHGISKAVGYYLARKVAKEIDVGVTKKTPETSYTAVSMKLHTALGKTSLRNAEIRLAENSTDTFTFSVPDRVVAAKTFAKDDKERIKLIEVNQSARQNMLGEASMKPRHRH